MEELEELEKLELEQVIWNWDRWKKLTSLYTSQSRFPIGSR